MTVAVLDACVLYRGTVTDFLLNVAEQGLFEPVWSDAIAEEWTRNLGLRTQIPQDRIAHRRVQMDRAFPGASCDADLATLKTVTGHCRSPAEEKDAHVVATAVLAEAAVIVTYNLSDFPVNVLSPFGLQAVPPDRFFQGLATRDVQTALAAARAHNASLRNPLLSRDEYLDLLSSPKAELHGTRTWLTANGF